MLIRKHVVCIMTFLTPFMKHDLFDLIHRLRLQEQAHVPHSPGHCYVFHREETVTYALIKLAHGLTHTRMSIGVSLAGACGGMYPRHFQNGEKIRFLGAQTLNFQVCGCTLCMVSIANVNARALTMLSVIRKHKHVM